MVQLQQASNYQNFKMNSASTIGYAIDNIYGLLSSIRNTIDADVANMIKEELAKIEVHCDILSQPPSEYTEECTIEHIDSSLLCRSVSMGRHDTTYQETEEDSYDEALENSHYYGPNRVLIPCGEDDCSICGTHSTELYANEEPFDLTCSIPTEEYIEEECDLTRSVFTEEYAVDGPCSWSGYRRDDYGWNYTSEWREAMSDSAFTQKIKRARQAIYAGLCKDSGVCYLYNIDTVSGCVFEHHSTTSCEHRKIDFDEEDIDAKVRTFIDEYCRLNLKFQNYIDRCGTKYLGKGPSGISERLGEIQQDWVTFNGIESGL